MHTGTKKVLLVCGIGLGLVLALSPLMIGYAQKETPRNVDPKANDEQARLAREQVAKSVVGSLILDKISVKEPAWVLDKAGYLPRHEQNKGATIDMSLKGGGDDSIGIVVSEYDSVEEADSRFSAPRAYGASVPFNKYGDRGDKLIGQKGDLMAIRFRKGNFFVKIFTKGDAKTAERFAQYISDAISGLAGK